MRVSDTAAGSAPALSELTAVVLNWRTPPLSVEAVRALLSDGVSPERVVVVDNGSDDGSAEALAAALPACVHVALDENVGFARANNAGAAALPGRAYLFVNSDAFVRRPGSVAALLRALEDPEVGLAVPRLSNPDGSLQPSVVPRTRPLAELVRASGLARLVPNGAQPRWATHWDHGTARAVEAAIGAVVLVRGTTWAELGGWTERAFMYAEDLDLCWRAAEAGWRVWFTPDADFTHLGNATAGQAWDDPERARRVAAAEGMLAYEHLSRPSAAASLAAMAAGAAARAIAHGALGRRARSRVLAAAARGYGAALTRGAMRLRSGPATRSRSEPPTSV